MFWRYKNAKKIIFLLADTNGMQRSSPDFQLKLPWTFPGQLHSLEIPENTWLECADVWVNPQTLDLVQLWNIFVIFVIADMTYSNSFILLLLILDNLSKLYSCFEEIKAKKLYKPMKKHNFNINILTILVKEVFQEMWHRLIGDMATNNNVPARSRMFH